MPCRATQQMGQSEEFCHNIVHWRRKWQPTPEFLPVEPYEQYEKEKRYDTRRWPPGQKVSNLHMSHMSNIGSSVQFSRSVNITRNKARGGVGIQLSYLNIIKMVLLKCCTQYASKFGELSSGQTLAMPKNGQDTIQLYSFHRLARYAQNSSD